MQVPIGRSGVQALPNPCTRTFDHSLEHLAALAGLGVGHLTPDGEAPLGVEIRIGLRQLQPLCEMNPRPRHSKSGRSSNTSHHLQGAEIALVGITRLY